jgi:protein-L-isoaspartate(D-aspartate) O-methyltransferase
MSGYTGLRPLLDPILKMLGLIRSERLQRLGAVGGRLLLLSLAAIPLTAANVAAADGPFADARRGMLDDIRAVNRAVAIGGGPQSISERTLAILDEVPRHRFVPKDLQNEAYENRPLPIGYGQTISQPYIVAVMTDVLDCQPGHKVLELGTGSGYQAAVLGQTGARVFTIEIIPELAQSAAARLSALGYETVRVRAGDGYYGWPEEAPFDRIIVTAAASHIPPPLIAQLAPGGRMAIPVGGPFAIQELLLVEKSLDESLHTQSLLPVQFVPLSGNR